MSTKRRLVFSTETAMEKVPDIAIGEKYIKTKEGSVLNLDGTPVAEKDEEIIIRKIEKEMLSSLAELSANIEKSAKNMYRMICIFEDIKKCEADYFVLDMEDHVRLVDAFEKTAEQRPQAWFKYCKSMIKQLFEPNEVEDEKSGN